MINNVKLGRIHSRDAEVNEYLDQMSAKRKLQVIDVGASANFWCSHVTAIVDVKASTHTDIKSFIGNINYIDVWDEVLEYTRVHGKFDFSICTHTLEDISNPLLVANMLSKVSKGGFIATPSKYVESRRSGAFGNSRGWMHHRWIFNHEDNNIVAYPKLPFTEYLQSLDIVGSQSGEEELSCYWEQSCDLVCINNDYFPSEGEGIQMYNRLID